MSKKRFIVEAKLPAGVSVKRFKEYIEEAVSAWKGQLEIADPMFELDSRYLSVKTFRKQSVGKINEVLPM